MIAVLLSGGMDSASVSWLIRPEIGLFIDYGQKPVEGEFRSAQTVANSLGIKLDRINIDCSGLGSGALSGTPALGVAPGAEWWPYRNQLLATIAATRALSLGIRRIAFGTVRTDGYHVDGTPLFYQRLADLIRLQEGAIEILTPGIEFDGFQLATLARTPADVLLATHSCHISEFACGLCGGCTKRMTILQGLNIDF